MPESTHLTKEFSPRLRAEATQQQQNMETGKKHR